MRFSYRIWTFIRQGYASYLVFPLGLLSTATVIYYLLVDNVPILKTIFPNFIYFFAIGSAGIIFLSALIGRWHYYRQPYKADNFVAMKGNPFTYMTQEGIQQEFTIPTQIEIMKALRGHGDPKKLDELIKLGEFLQRGGDIRKITS